MNSYSKLLKILNDEKETCQENFNGAKLTTDFDKSKILDLIVWKYTINGKDFKLVKSNYNFNVVPVDNLKQFFKSIKLCFREYYIESCASFFSKYL